MFAFGLQDLHLHTRNIICRHYPLAPTYAKAVAGRKGCVCVCVSLHWYAHMPDSYAIAQPFSQRPAGSSLASVRRSFIEFECRKRNPTDS